MSIIIRWLTFHAPCGRGSEKKIPRRIRIRLGAGPPGEGDKSSSIPVGPHRGMTGMEEKTGTERDVGDHDLQGS